MHALIENANNRIAAISEEAPTFNGQVWVADGLRFGWLNSDSSARVQAAPPGAKVNDILASDGTHTPVAPPPAPAPELIVDPYEWLIDIGPFFDRFGSAKMAVLTSADAGVKAILQDVTVRKWIDLKRADVASSLAYLGSKVPAVNAAMQTAIINNPVQPIENIALRNTKVFG